MRRYISEAAEAAEVAEAGGPIALSEDGVDALVGGVFFVVEGADVGGDEGFDGVSESSGGFTEGHTGA